jgi:hypothetical protein
MDDRDRKAIKENQFYQEQLRELNTLKKQQKKLDLSKSVYQTAQIN